ncbi:hypothetical protein vseg_018184 [Gypsophila vaccaria]
MEAIVAVHVAVLMMTVLVPSVSAANVEVGGSAGWELATNFTYWTASNPIFVNDSLVFRYSPEHDVIEVSEANFFTCDTSSPIAAYNDKDGMTLINLTQPGPRYFVCGRSNHCPAGLKLRVYVLESPQLLPNVSSPNYPTNQTDNRTVSSDSPSNEHKEHTLESSAGHINASIHLLFGIIILVSSITAGFT